MSSGFFAIISRLFAYNGRHFTPKHSPSAPGVNKLPSYLGYRIWHTDTADIHADILLSVTSYSLNNERGGGKENTSHLTATIECWDLKKKIFFCDANQNWIETKFWIKNVKLAMLTWFSLSVNETQILFWLPLFFKSNKIHIEVRNDRKSWGENGLSPVGHKLQTNWAETNGKDAVYTQGVTSTHKV